MYNKNKYISLNKVLVAIVFLFISITVFAQKKSTVYGTVFNEKGQGLEYVNISVAGEGIGTYSNQDGRYNLSVPSGKKIIVIFSSIGFEERKVALKLQEGERKKLNVTLNSLVNIIDDVVIKDKSERTSNITRLDPRVISSIPDVSGGVEGLVKVIGMGVSSNNELSSQYSVRGGNFDENLVYINDIEVYRPFLIRSGQQEGLSIVNPDMVNSVLFSSGGFDAKYGDKMSSVLDIKYKHPRKTAASVSMGLLGGTAHVEGTSKSRRFTHISGIRYKTTQYLLSSMDVKGDYKPSFTDFQTYMTYDVTDKLELSFLGNFNNNKYSFIPQTRETSFGTINEALKLKIYFDGKEVDAFTTYLGAFSAKYRPKKNVILSFVSSGYATREVETFDIQGQYYLNELDKELGSDNMGDSLMNIGVGAFLNHARNNLKADVYSFSHKGYHFGEKGNTVWGIKYRREKFDYSVNEWEMLDSAGYSLPLHDTLVMLSLNDFADINMEANRIESFIKQEYFFDIDSNQFSVNAGVRFSYLDFTGQYLFSPRVAFSYKPNIKKDVLFRLSTGLYYQPPFFKEIRRMSGDINHNIKAQRSIHYVAGVDYNFRAWNRTFKFVSELYYKDLDNLIPYNIDNVRIKYFGENMASGYVYGLDLKVNGEFVKGVDSWVNMSIMRAMEDIDDDGHGYIERPSNRTVSFSLFFQDYFPTNPTYKVHLNLMFATGLPYGPPNGERYMATGQMPAYRRVDIGMSKEILGVGNVKGDELPDKKFVKNVWIGLEVFNLLGINNTISHTWIKDIYGREYGVPNYLTNRRVNVKLTAKF